MIEYIDMTCIGDTQRRMIPVRISSAVASAEDLATSLGRFNAQASLAESRMAALIEAFRQPSTRNHVGGRLARGPRRGASMRRRALHLKWRAVP